MIAQSSFGEDYECKKEWPEGSFLQCGSEGTGEINGEAVFFPAFIEFFQKSPSMFIRGEGDNVELAEQDAWSKYTKIINCPKHEYVKQKDGTTGKCKYCDFLKQHYFLPENKCALCDKKNIFNKIYNSNVVLCFEHLITEMLENKGKNYKYEKKDLIKYYQEKAVLYKVLKNENLIDFTKNDYNLCFDIDEKYFNSVEYKQIMDNFFYEVVTDFYKNEKSKEKYKVNLLKFIVFKNNVIEFLIEKDILLLEKIVLYSIKKCKKTQIEDYELLKKDMINHMKENKLWNFEC